MTYCEAISYLGSMQRFGIKPGLLRTGSLCLALGRPERSMGHLHIAGTNGKGSVAVMCESVIRQAGIKTGLFTSPHLSDYGERMRVDGEPIRAEELASLTWKLKQVVDEHAAGGEEPPTEFEICTAMCLDYFRSEGVKLAVMEVGLGGRYNSTNVIDPEAAVITHISYDHMERLGKSLDLIAFDKCGILKKGAPAVSAMQSEEAALMIRREASAIGSPLSEPGNGYRYKLLGTGLYGTDVEFSGVNVAGSFRTSLIGTHQADNAACAIAAIDALVGLGWQISPKDISLGLKRAAHPGRFELIKGDPDVIFDGAHNLDGATALASTLQNVLGAEKPVAVVGFSKDKDFWNMLKVLSPHLGAVVATAPSHARSGSRDAEAVLEAARGLGLPATGKPIAGEALETGIETARRMGARLLVCGSLYLVGELRSLHLKRMEVG